MMPSMVDFVPRVAYVDPLSNSPRSDSDDSRTSDLLPFDLDEQKTNVAFERSRVHARWCDRMYESQRMSHDNRRISLKILVTEAFQRDLAEAKRRGDDCSNAQRKQMWNDIAQRIMFEMQHQDNSANVLKNLSCMCVFISDNICREYGENVEARQRRIDKMRESLRRLREKGSLFFDGSNDSCESMHDCDA